MLAALLVGGPRRGLAGSSRPGPGRPEAPPEAAEPRVPARHRLDRALPAQPAALRRPPHPRGRRGDRRGRRGGGRDPGPPGRILRRRAGGGHHAGHRPPARLSLLPAHDRLRGRARAEPPERDDRHRRVDRAALRPARPVGGPLGEGAGVRGGRARDRAAGARNPDPPHPAGLRADPRRAGGHLLRPEHADGGEPELPRAGRPAAVARARGDARRRTPVPEGRAPGGRRPRAGHLPRRARLQLPRGRAPGPSRPRPPGGPREEARPLDPRRHGRPAIP